MRSRMMIGAALAVALSAAALPPSVESAQARRSCMGVYQGKGQRKANKANRWR